MRGDASGIINVQKSLLNTSESASNVLFLRLFISYIQDRLMGIYFDQFLMEGRRLLHNGCGLRGRGSSDGSAGNKQGV